MPSMEPLSPVQHLERLGLQVYLTSPPGLRLKVDGLSELSEEMRQWVLKFLAEQREEIRRILVPYHSGEGPRLDGGPCEEQEQWNSVAPKHA